MPQRRRPPRSSHDASYFIPRASAKVRSAWLVQFALETKLSRSRVSEGSTRREAQSVSRRTWSAQEGSTPFGAIVDRFSTFPQADQRDRHREMPKRADRPRMLGVRQTLAMKNHLLQTVALIAPLLHLVQAHPRCTQVARFRRRRSAKGSSDVRVANMTC